MTKLPPMRVEARPDGTTLRITDFRDLVEFWEAPASDPVSPARCRSVLLASQAEMLMSDTWIEDHCKALADQLRLSRASSEGVKANLLASLAAFRRLLRLKTGWVDGWQFSVDGDVSGAVSKYVKSGDCPLDRSEWAFYSQSNTWGARTTFLATTIEGITLLKKKFP